MRPADGIGASASRGSFSRRMQKELERDMGDVFPSVKAFVDETVAQLDEIDDLRRRVEAMERQLDERGIGA